MDGGHAGARADDRVEDGHLGDRLDAERRGATPAVASSGTAGGMVQTAATTPARLRAPTPAKSTVTGSIGSAGPVKALVPTVTGAPGDGSTTLTSGAAA